MLKTNTIRCKEKCEYILNSANHIDGNIEHTSVIVVE